MLGVYKLVEPAAMFSLSLCADEKLYNNALSVYVSHRSEYAHYSIINRRNAII